MHHIHIVAQPVEADGRCPQAQAAALGTEQALVDGIEDGHDKKQHKEHSEGQNKHIGGQGPLAESRLPGP